MKMVGKSVRINIPYGISEKLKSKMSSAGYDSIEAYVNYILSQLVSSGGSEEYNAYGEEEEKNVRESLKELGYL